MESYFEGVSGTIHTGCEASRGDKRIYCVPIPVFGCPVRRTWGGFLLQLVNSMSRKFFARIPEKSGSANRTFVIYDLQQSPESKSATLWEKRLQQGNNQRLKGISYTEARKKRPIKMLKNEACEVAGKAKWQKEIALDLSEAELKPFCGTRNLANFEVRHWGNWRVMGARGVFEVVDGRDEKSLPAGWQFNTLRAGPLPALLAG